MSIERLKSMEERAMCLAEQGLNQDVSDINAKELGEIIDVVKDIAETKYYCSITKAMEESDEAEKYMKKYLPEMAYARHEPGERYYTVGRGGRPRMTRYDDSGMGSYIGSTGMNNGGRRNYTRPNEYMFEMYPEMYDETYKPYHDEYDGDSWKYRRNYMENKHEKGNNTDSINELNEYVKSLTDDIMDMVEKATPQEKTMLKQKINGLANKID